MDWSPRALVRALGKRVANLRPEERVPTLVMCGTIFTLMVSYYVLKTVREPWILTTGGAEQKTYAAAYQAAALVLVLPLFNTLVAKVDSKRLVVGLTLFFLLTIQAFFAGALLGTPGLGFVFYVWVGIFSLSTIALFWSFANDVVDKEKGERIFPLVTVGMTAGPVVGSKLGSVLFAADWTFPWVLQAGGALLLVHLVLYLWLFRDPTLKAGDAEPNEQKSALETSLRGFQLLMAKPYLRRIALLLILLNIVNTTGEYILGSYVESMAESAEDPGRFIGEFFGDFYFGVSVLGVALQLLVASSLVKRFGIGSLLYALPVIALVNYSLVAFGVAFSVFRVIKTTENASDYSLMNNAKAMLWLNTTREEKYAAKQTIDTLFVRFGDMLAAAVVWVGTAHLEWSEQAFGMFNVAIIAVWLGVAWLLVRSYSAGPGAEVEAG